MKILRAFGRGLFVVITSLCLAALISLSTLQATILNRDAVGRWLVESQIYTNIIGTIVQLEQAGSGEEQFLDDQIVGTAIKTTLDPTFLQQSTEKVLDATYDWLEGESNSIEFSIPLDGKRAELQKNLSAAIKPRVSSLPTCTSNFSNLSSTNVSCMPAGTDAQKFSDSLAKRAIESSDFLKEPLTESNTIKPDLSRLEFLRFVTTNLQVIIASLAAAAALSAAGFVLLSNNKLVGLKTIGRRTFFGTILTVIIGAALWTFARQISLGSFGDAVIIDQVVDPLAHVVLTDVGKWLFIFSGIVFAISGAVWLGAFLLVKRFEHPQIPPVMPGAPPKDLPPTHPTALQ